MLLLLLLPFFISIHALREEGDEDLEQQLQVQAWISIHALREEGDRRMFNVTARKTNFYPRPPRGGRPQFANLGEQPVKKFLSTPSARRATCDRRMLRTTQ